MSSDQRDLMLRGGAKVWNRWRQANSPDMTFSRPHWYDCPNRNGLQVKGRNRLNFSKLNLSGARVYDAFAEGLNLSGAILENVYFDGGDFSRASFAGATIRDSKFNKTIFTDASFNEATIVNCNLNRVNLVRADFTVSEISETVVYGISAWDLTLGEQSKQSKLIIEPTHELYSELVARGTLPSMVDDIELAQFIYFLSGHKRLRDAINILNDKAILLLGRFADGGIGRLYEIKDRLKDHGYTAMIFDFDRPDNLSLTETIVTMAGLCKFIVADVSGPSVPAELQSILSQIKKPVIAFGRRYALLSDIEDQTNVIHIDVESLSPLDDIVAALPTVERLHTDRIGRLAERYKL